MKKSGFVLVETIIVVVVLTSSLLLLYSTFNRILQTEKTRVYYDDVNLIYRTWYIKNTLDSLNFLVAQNDLNNRTENGRNIFFVTLGTEYKGLFDGFEEKKLLFAEMIKDYDVSKIILVNRDKIDNIKKCDVACSTNTNCDNFSNCNEVYTNLSEDMISYLKTLNIDLQAPYILVVEYNICDNNNKCRNYYGWVGV